MKRWGLILAGCAGTATVAYLVVSVGLGAVLAAALSLGWSGFALFCGLGIILFAILSAAWSVLIPRSSISKWPTYFWGRAVRDSAGEVLPLSQFGGFVIGARAVALRGVSAAEAYASTVVDITTELLAQIVFVFLGAAVFIRHLGLHSSHSRLLLPLLVGPLLAALGAAGFIFVQQRGPRLAEKLAVRVLPQAVRHAGAFARSIAAIYAAPWRVVLSITIHFTGWMASACASWIAIRLIGGHIGYFSMVGIESALCAIRSATVVVPSAMGVQEVTYMMLMPMFGVGPEIGLALSLLKRGRDIALGIPVLLAWQGLEGRHAFSAPTPKERLSEN